MRRCSVSIELFTVYLSAVIGGLALTTPISLAWAHGTASLEMELLVYSLPRATAVGGVAAVITAVFATTTSSAVVAWGSAVGGCVVLLANHVLGQYFSGFAPLTTLNYIDCLAGGVLLGGLAAAVQFRRLPTLMAALGAMTSIMLSDLSVSDAEFTGTAGNSPLAWFVVDSPPQWLLWPATALIAVCAYTHRGRAEEQAISVELPLRPIVAVLLMALSTVAGSAWLVREESTIADALPVALVTVVTAMLTALLLPGRDGELILCAVAVAAAGGATVVLPLTGWMVPLLIAAGVGGMVLGRYRPMPLAGVAGTAGLSLFAVLTARPEGPVPAASVAGCLLLTLVTGYCLAATMPRSGAPTLLLGLIVLFLPGAVVAVRARIFGVGFALPRQWEVPRAYGRSDLLLYALPGAVAALVTVGCALGILLLWRWRKPAADRADERATGVDVGRAD
ncbi:hypothetical protein IU418_25095 [Nocardia farcinica]|nr:hypothetical protein [Nocardia farcinica]